jgi:hypothetical protein
MFMFFFSFLTTLVALGAGVLIVMLIVRGVNHGQNIRHEAYREALEKGVYDYRLLERPRRKRGAGSLGWGIVFVAIGIALLIGFLLLGIFRESAIGGLIPLLVGAGLLLFHFVMRGRADEDLAINGEPVRFAPDSSVVTPASLPRKEEKGLGS